MGWRDTLDILKDKTVDLAQAGMAQSKKLAEIAKLKTDNMSEEDAIKKAYLEIGKLYYAEKGALAEGPYAAACEKITAAKAAIETNNERIAELRDNSDDEAAPVCDESVPAEEPVVTPSDFEEPVSEEPSVEEPAAEEPKTEE